jgi:hypothetical protein
MGQKRSTVSRLENFNRKRQKHNDLKGKENKEVSKKKWIYPTLGLLEYTTTF